MQITITDLSLYAKTILEQHSSWRVHSVYRKTVNLQAGDSLLALQAAASPLSPISLITTLDTAGMDALDASTGGKVSFSGLTLDQARIWDLSLRPLHLSVGQTSLLSALYAAIRRADDQGFRLLFFPDQAKTAPSLILDAAKKSLTDCRLSFHAKHYEAAAEALVHLTGLGIGLTPSGDDFLCGMLAGLILADIWETPFAAALKSEIQAHLGSTNDISRAFLSCALNRQFSLPVISLARHTGTYDPGEILASFSKIGHSSGIDTLCGIYYLFTLLYS